jgi:hypothetical protein
MKGQKNSSWEFHGFSSNPEKSYASGKKGSVLATQASLKQSTNPTSEASSTSKATSQNKSAQGKNWQNPQGSAKDSKSKKSSTEE